MYGTNPLKLSEENKSIISQERRIFLMIFLIKSKISSKNSETMAKKLGEFIKLVPGLTAEKLGAKLPEGKELAGQTIRTIIKKATNEDGKSDLLSHERTSDLLKLFDKIANEEINERKNYTLKNHLCMDFYTYPGEEELRCLLKNPEFKDFNSEQILNYIIKQHDVYTDKLYSEYYPKIVSRRLQTSGNIIKKDEYIIEYSNGKSIKSKNKKQEYSFDVFSKESVINSPNYNKLYLPENINKILTEIDSSVLSFFNKHIRFLRLISSFNKPKNFAEKILNIKEISLVQFETKNYKLSDAMVSNIIESFINESNVDNKNLFDWVFSELSHTSFQRDIIMQKKFSDLIDDFTFIKAEYFRDNTRKIRLETLKLLEADIHFFVLQTYMGYDGEKIKSLGESLS